MDIDAEILTRLARIEERQKIDHGELARSRKRLHSLEGATQGLLELQRQKIRAERQRDKRADRRFRFMTVVVAVAGIIIPTVTFIHGVIQ